MAFSSQKEIRLKKEDLSRKGSIDSKILELIEYINAQDCYVSTSSCSGRTTVFMNSEYGKKDLKWIFISHEIANPQDVIDALSSHTGSAILKFEPFVLHVQCATIEDAQNLQALAIASGFKNSGLSIGKKGKIIVAIRSSLSLETPLSCNGITLVSEQYISYLVHSCNEKMKENWHRIDRFFTGLKKVIADSSKKLEVEKRTKKLNQKNHKSYREKKVEVTELNDSFDILFHSFSAQTPML